MTLTLIDECYDKNFVNIEKKCQQVPTRFQKEIKHSLKMKQVLIK